MLEFVDVFKGYGLPGMIIGALLFLYWRKDEQCRTEREAMAKELAVERAARTGDAKEYGALALSIMGRSQEVIDKVKAVADVLDKLLDRMDNDRNDRKAS